MNIICSYSDAHPTKIVPKSAFEEFPRRDRGRKRITVARNCFVKPILGPNWTNCLRFASPASAIRESRSRMVVSSDIGMLFHIGNGNQFKIVSKSFLYDPNLSKIHWKSTPNRPQMGSVEATCLGTDFRPSLERVGSHFGSIFGSFLCLNFKARF